MNTLRTRIVAAVSLSLYAASAHAALPNADQLRSRWFGDAPAELSVPRASGRRRPSPSPAPSPSRPSGGGSGSLPAFIFTGRGADVSDEVTAAIDSAQTSIQAALYTLTLQNAADALVRAQQRGVQVQVIYDYGHSQNGKGGAGSQPFASSSELIGTLVSGGVDVRVLRGSGQYGIMHNKFAVIDGHLVETGSFNWTTAADTKNHENAIFRDNQSLASDYAGYFAWMWRQSSTVGSTPGTPSGTPPSCADGPTALGRAWPQCSFSPSGPTEDLIAEAIGRAQSRVHVAMFSFSSPKIVSALTAAQRRGVEVLLVLDRLQAKTESAALSQLQSAGIPYRIDAGLGGSGGVLHDKFGVFDDLLELGSFNYTTNASNNNYENAFFSAEASDVAGYDQEFQQIYAEGSAQ